MCYDWGTPVKANGKRAIYVGENPDFYRCSDSGKHLVIFENEEEVCEVNKVVKTTFKPKKSKDGFPTWGTWVHAWDDELDKIHPITGIILAVYTDIPDEPNTTFLVIPEEFQDVPSEPYYFISTLDK